MSKLKITPYDGSTNIEDWIEHFNLVVEASGKKWGENIKEVNVRAITEIKLAMVGPMKAFLKTLPHTTLESYEKILKSLLEHKKGNLVEFDMRTTAINLKQSSFDNVSDYFSEKVSKLVQVFPDKPQLVLDFYIDGLNEDIKLWVLNQPAELRKDVYQVKELSVGFERIFNAQKIAESVNTLDDQKNLDRLEKLEKDLIETKKMLDSSVRKNKYLENKLKSIENFSQSNHHHSKSSYEDKPKHTSKQCFKCKSNEHEGPWDSSCRFHNPNFKSKSFIKTDESKFGNKNFRNFQCTWCQRKGHDEAHCHSKADGAPKKTDSKN